ncbi:MAG: UDP-N-acetylglucosamine diphosphorylase [Chlamydiales bacterium]|nr:UDP-N-acetylglucosamine diphosphorylase [Chlamydiales bacterium]
MLTPERFFDLSSFFHRSVFLDQKPIWESLNHLKNYLETLKLGKIDCKIPEGVYLVNPNLISIGPDTVVEPGAYIEGPAVIGNGCQIRHSAYIRGNVIAGDRCIIGHSSEIKHSILLNDAKAPHFNYVGDSILGNFVNLGAGVICANFRLDHREVIVEIGNEQFKTGTNKFGAIIGDGSQIGCNSVTNPGVLLRKKTYSRACTSIQKSNLRTDNHVQTTFPTR